MEEAQAWVGLGEVAPAAGGEVVNDGDRVAPGQKKVGEVRADEARTAGDERVAAAAARGVRGLGV